MLLDRPSMYIKQDAGLNSAAAGSASNVVKDKKAKGSTPAGGTSKPSTAAAGSKEKQGLSDKKIEGIYIRVDAGEYLLDRSKVVRANFIETIEAGGEHWSKAKLIKNQIDFEAMYW